MMTCSKKGCCLPAVKNKCRNTSYCWKHYRFWAMRLKAANKNKKVPTFSELEKMLNKINNMACPVCDEKMVWHKSLGELKNVITLQHETNGTMSMMCYSCNSTHGPRGDVFYVEKFIERLDSTFKA